MPNPITPCLWFDTEAEEAARFYCSIFKNSKITQISHYSEAGPRPKGSVMLVAFELDGRPFTALNGGPQYKFTEAISLQIYCDSQTEVDHYWDRLTADGGSENVCGWLKDKYGLSWQVAPRNLIEYMTGPDVEKAKRVAEAMFKMKKIDVAAIERAAQA